MKVTYSDIMALGIGDFLKCHKGSASIGKKLLAYEQQYELTTSEFLEIYDLIMSDHDLGLNDSNSKVIDDLMDWKFTYSMFIKAKGDPFNLHSFSMPDKDEDDTNASSSFFS